MDGKTYDQSIELLRKAINKSKLGIREKNEALNRLNMVRRLSLDFRGYLNEQCRDK